MDAKNDERQQKLAMSLAFPLLALSKSSDKKNSPPPPRWSMPSASLAPVCFFLLSSKSEAVWTGVIRLVLCSFVSFFVDFRVLLRVCVNELAFVCVSSTMFVFAQRRNSWRDVLSSPVFFLLLLVSLVSLVSRKRQLTVRSCFSSRVTQNKTTGWLSMPTFCPALERVGGRKRGEKKKRLRLMSSITWCNHQSGEKHVIGDGERNIRRRS